MARRKCAICGRQIGDGDEVIPYKTRTAHKSCFDSLVRYVKDDKDKTRKVNEKAKVEKEKEKKKILSTPIKVPLKVSEEEYQEKKATFDLIESLLGEQMKAKHYHILESYINKYGFTYAGIKIALEYYFIDKQNAVEDDNLLGILPYIYDDAIASAKAVETAREVNKNVLNTVNELYPKNKIVAKRMTKPEPQLIDISSIGI